MKGESLRSKPYYKTNALGHKLARDRAVLLYQRLTKNGECIEAKLDDEIKRAIADPAYRDSNHPSTRKRWTARALYDLRYRDE